MNLREEGYWDQHYATELENYNDTGDQGEIWFGKNIGNKIANWIVSQAKSIQPDQCNVIDIGCGNAHLLVTLHDLYKTSGLMKSKLNLVGLDYSANSIELSKRIATQHKIESETLQLHQCDILETETLRKELNSQKFDYILDKGTFDAICLLAADSHEKLKQAHRDYRQSIISLSEPGTIFIIASCNHTKEEILEALNTDARAFFTVKGQIETPKIVFGGQQGSQVTCLILEFIGVDS